MMLGKITPVMLPAEQSDINLIQSRQNKLARDIDIINQKIRNNVISSAEGAKRIMFKKSEIDQLEIYKRSRRTPTGRLSPPPQTARPVSKKPANKYNPAAPDKVSSATKPNVFSVQRPQYKRSTPRQQKKNTDFNATWNSVENDRAGMTSKSNQRPSGSRPPSSKETMFTTRNKANYLIGNYQTRLLQNYIAQYGKRPQGRNEQKKIMADAVRLWEQNAMMPAMYRPTPKSTPTPTQEATSKAKSVWDKATSKAKSAAKSKASARAPKKTIKDNPFGRSYGTTYSRTEKALSAGKAKKYNGIYYGPSNPAKISAWSKWNIANLSGLGGMPQAALVRRKAEMNREMALMRKRAGAAIRLDQPQVARATTMRSWETYGRPEEVAVIKSFVPMLIGLEKFPELTPEGNAMMIEVIQAGNDEKKMTAAANKLATDLVNKSGYFVKKYNVEVDPLQKKVKVSEMSGLAGGLPKTRNSMQRLLK